jgi:hypothetical protein
MTPPRTLEAGDADVVGRVSGSREGDPREQIAAGLIVVANDLNEAAA